MPRALGLAPLALALCACGGGDAPAASAPAPAAAEPPWFEEVGRQAGLDFVHVFGREQRYDFPEIMGPGVGLLDFDGDGALDVYLVQSGDLRGELQPPPGNRLFRNRGDGRFDDVTEAAGVGDTGYGMGCAVGDYDGDGDPDLYVTNVGPDVLYRNEGDGRFTDVTAEAGLGSPEWGTSASFLDFDADGELDLYVANYVVWSPEVEAPCASRDGRRDYCNPESYARSADVLYRNESGGRFRDVSAQAGLRDARGNGLGVACADFDGDLRTDVYVANDMTPNQLWRNLGEGRLEEVALLWGCAFAPAGFPEAGMGVQAEDVTGDGLLDLFVTNMRHQTHRLYAGAARGFEDATAKAGLGAPTLASTGFGTGFADFDHDGRLDLYVANGRVTLEEPIPRADAPYAEEDQLFRGTPDGRFAPVPGAGLRAPLLGSSRGAAFGDLDGDGDVDAVVAQRGERVHLLRNLAGGRGSWVLLRVLDARGRDALDARVTLEAGGAVQRRRVHPNASYCSSNDPRVHFGLGAAERVERARVRWPDGTEEVWTVLPARRLHVLRRGAGGR